MLNPDTFTPPTDAELDNLALVPPTIDEADTTIIATEEIVSTRIAFSSQATTWQSR